jgi:hypothetical protein
MNKYGCHCGFIPNCICVSIVRKTAAREMYMLEFIKVLISFKIFNYNCLSIKFHSVNYEVSRLIISANAAIYVIECTLQNTKTAKATQFPLCIFYCRCQPSPKLVFVTSLMGKKLTSHASSYWWSPDHSR